MTDKSEETGWKAFKYATLSTEIPVMAFAGYIIGKQLGREIEGALVGVLLGTFLMWFHALYTFRRLDKPAIRKPSQWSIHRVIYHLITFNNNGHK